MTETSDVQSIEVNGTRLHYVEQGSGETLVLAHGSLGDFRTWAPQMAALSTQYRVVAYSRRYHYPNAGGGAGDDYTAALHAADLTGLIDALGAGPVFCAGTSFGAYTTLMAAMTGGAHFKKLVLCEPPVVPWLRDSPAGLVEYEAFMRATWLPAAQAFERGDLEGGVKAFIEGVSGAPGSFEHIPAPARERMMQNARSLRAETQSPEYFEAPRPEQAAGVDLPVLLLRGERSPRMFHLICDRLAACLPRVTQMTVPGASHSMSRDNPEFFNREVLHFLGG